MPGVGRPTVPSLKPDGPLAVTAPQVSVMP